MTEPGLIVALDFGGTKMAAAVAGSDGQIVDTATVPTKPADGADRAMQRILDAATGLARRAQGTGRVTAVGVATMASPLPIACYSPPTSPAGSDWPSRRWSGRGSPGPRFKSTTT